ncbi:MAG: DUF1700 domain-containing protein [Bacillota bacterium]
MTKELFLKELKAKLIKLPQTDRENAISFYTEYIDDALENGKTMEELEKALGKPDDVAAKIIADYSVNRAKEKPSLTNGFKALIAVLGVFAIPIAAPAAIAIVAIIFALLITVFSVAFSLIMAAFGLFVAVAAMLGVSIMLMFTDPLLGVASLGASMIASGILILLAYCFIKLASLMVTGTSFLIKKIFDKNRKEGVSA